MEENDIQAGHIVLKEGRALLRFIDKNPNYCNIRPILALLVANIADDLKQEREKSRIPIDLPDKED